MSEGFRKGYVYVRGIYAGELSETDSGYSFRYERDYLSRPGALAVSLTMPLSESVYESPVLFPFFDGLIPEGWLLEVASRNWKVDRKDRFALLLCCCRDCVGDVSVRREADEM